VVSVWDKQNLRKFSFSTKILKLVNSPRDNFDYCNKNLISAWDKFLQVLALCEFAYFLSVFFKFFAFFSSFLHPLLKKKLVNNLSFFSFNFEKVNITDKQHKKIFFSSKKLWFFDKSLKFVTYGFLFTKREKCTGMQSLKVTFSCVCWMIKKMKESKRSLIFSHVYLFKDFSRERRKVFHIFFKEAP
jgi:hypothetical protein